ncbi:MAG: AraC family transcriptional regulator [Eubacteriales bacterium]|nr:AraC family transcriptional regulator [Eubacteriales bacterium]
MVDFKISPPLETPEIFSFRVPNIAGLLSIYRHIDNLWTFKKQSYKLKCMAGLYEMFSLLNDTSLSPYCPGYKFEQIRPSIDYLEANYNNPEITNNMLSTKSGISTVYFRKIFTEKYGISPMKYLQIKRIEKAKDMLLSEIGSISNVSDATGFNSIYHFSRAFHNMTGYSPTEFIREYARRAPKKVE